MGPRRCPACGRPQGSNAGCLSCREAAARELAAAARDVTPDALPERASRLGAFLHRPPWWARASPGKLRARLRLFWMVLRDAADGSYRRVSTKAVAALLAAGAYVMSPLDLVPDVFIPAGWADDLLLVAVAWSFVKRELRAYCAWKGLSPSHFGL
ncbi:MAG TPA: DUF1232 domain-containing protein [Anaeromyxobacter sp.]|nr:DUF1232 domain-containing protein [Anaeromyxobacter sp.]